MTTRLIWALWTGLAAAACGGGDGDATGDGSGSADDTGEPLTSVPFDDFYALAEEAYCAWQVECNAYGVEARCATVNHIEQALSMRSISGVGNGDPVPIDYMREAIAAGRITYDEKRAAACIEYVRARSCEHDQLHVASEEELAGRLACAELFVGRMTANGPCMSASECAGLAVCGFNPNCTDACCVGACRVLPGAAELGEPCPNGDCVAGSYCDFDPNTGNNTTCKAAPGLGQACGRGICAVGAVCDFTGDQAICVAPKKPGQRCYGNEECEQPGSCRYDPNIGDQTCFRPAEAGGACNFDYGGLQCMRFDHACGPSNTCEPLPGKNEACGNVPCAGDLFCSESLGYRCSPVADEGEFCGYNQDTFEYIPCSGDNYCDNEFENGKCVAPVAAASCPVPDDPVPAG